MRSAVGGRVLAVVGGTADGHLDVGPADQAMPFFRSEMARFAQLVKKAGVELQ